MHTADNLPHQPKRWDSAHFPPDNEAAVNLNNTPNQLTVDHLTRNGVDSWIIVTKEKPDNPTRLGYEFNIDHVQRIVKQGVGLPRATKDPAWSTWYNPLTTPKGYMVITVNSI